MKVNPVTLTTILFDAGDVLYSKPRRKPAIAAFLTGRGYAAPVEGDPVEKEKRLKAHAGGISAQEFFEWLMAHYRVTDPEHVAAGIRLMYEQQADVVFFEGVPETLHELKSRGFKLGIVTNTFNSRSEKDVWFSSVGIESLWDSYADSSVLKMIKPEAGIYLAALEPLGVSPQEAAFVGHAQGELDGAKSVGLTTIMFNPDIDCTVADYQCDRFSDLLNVLPVVLASKTSATASKTG